MSHIAMPEIDPAIVAQRYSIVAGLRALVPPGSVLDSEDERRPQEIRKIVLEPVVNL